MRLKLAGEFRDVQAEPLEPMTSRSTGRSLRHVRLDVRVGDALTDALESELHAASRRTDAPLVGENGDAWVAGDWSSSYTEGHSSRRYLIELTELEQIRPTSLEFQGLSFAVEHYAESAMEDGPLVIEAEFVAAGEETDRIRDLMNRGEYFDLMRVGAVEEPLRVRLGTPVWQTVSSGEEGRRFQMVFVSEAGDDAGTAVPEDPEPHHTMEIALKERARLRALLDELQAVGTLSESARARIDDAGDGGWLQDRLDVRRVEDVTKHRL